MAHARHDVRREAILEWQVQQRGTPGHEVTCPSCDPGEIGTQETDRCLPKTSTGAGYDRQDLTTGQDVAPNALASWSASADTAQTACVNCASMSGPRPVTTIGSIGDGTVSSLTQVAPTSRGKQHDWTSGGNRVTESEPTRPAPALSLTAGATKVP